MCTVLCYEFISLVCCYWLLCKLKLACTHLDRLHEDDVRNVYAYNTVNRVINNHVILEVCLNL